MASSSRGNRKRVRSAIDEECDESLPISKRINGLHIQTERNQINQTGQISPQVNGHHRVVDSWQQNASQLTGLPQLSPLAVSAAQQMNNQTSPNCHYDSRQSNSSGSSVLHPDLQNYEPELTSSENPHYYHINEVLYQAHVERRTRTNHYFTNT